MLSVIRGLISRQTQTKFRPLRFYQKHQISRLLSSLALLEQREGKLNNASLSAVTAAQKLGGSITGFIAGSGARSVAEEAAKVKGLERVIMIENGSYDKVSMRSILASITSTKAKVRGFLRTSLHCSPKTLRKKVSPIYLLATQLLAKTLCLGWQPS